MVRLRLQNPKFTRFIKNRDIRFIQSGIKCADRFCFISPFVIGYLGRNRSSGRK